MVKPNEEVDRLARHSKLVRLSQDERVQLTQARRKSLEPLCQYLDEQGLQEGRDYQIFKSTGTVTVGLNPQQAEALKKMPYIQNMTEDFGELELIQ